MSEKIGYQVNEETGALYREVQDGDHTAIAHPIEFVDQSAVIPTEADIDERAERRALVAGFASAAAMARANKAREIDPTKLNGKKFRLRGE